MAEVESKIEGFFPTLLQFSRNPHAAGMHKTMIPALKKLQEETPNSAPASVDAPHYSTLWSALNLLEDKPEYHPLRDFIYQEAYRFAEFLKLDVKNHQLIMAESWVNIHGHGHFQEKHVHQNSIISGVYYVQVPKNSGDFVVHSPYQATMLMPPETEANVYTAKSTPIRGEEGIAIMFRSFVEHGVRMNRSNQERISISFNFRM